MITLRVDMARLSVAVSLALLALFGGRALMGLDWFITFAFAGTILAWVSVVLALYPGDLTQVLARLIDSLPLRWRRRFQQRVVPWLTQAKEVALVLGSTSATLLATWAATLRARSGQTLSRA